MRTVVCKACTGFVVVGIIYFFVAASQGTEQEGAGSSLGELCSLHSVEPLGIVDGGATAFAVRCPTAASFV